MCDLPDLSVRQSEATIGVLVPQLNAAVSRDEDYALSQTTTISGLTKIEET